MTCRGLQRISCAKTKGQKGILIGVRSVPDQLYADLQSCQFFSSDPMGPKVTWTVMLLDFGSWFPVLQVNRNLHKYACQFSSRFKRLTLLEGIRSTALRFKHANTLTDFIFGRVSGLCGSFKPSSAVRAWFLLANASLELYADTHKNCIELGFESIRRCPVCLSTKFSIDPRTRDFACLFYLRSLGPQSLSVLQNKT